MSWDGSVGSNGLRIEQVGIRFLAGSKYYSILHIIQTEFEVHPTSYLMGAGGSFPGDKAGRA
jgi:hypothetical protein